jgi:site-specific recombinase XerD
MKLGTINQLLAVVALIGLGVLLLPRMPQNKQISGLLSEVAKTILEPDQMRKLLNSIAVVREVKIPRKHGGGVRVEADVKGLRDRAIIAIMAYTFARVSAVLKLKRSDYSLQGKRARLRLLEKGNKEKLVWLHHELEQYLDAYLDAGKDRRARRAGVSDAE